MAEIPLTKGMKILSWIVILQALSVAVTLIFFPTQTETLFFWEINPPINAVLLGILYTSTVIFVGQALWRGRWETMRYLVPMLTFSSAMLVIATLLHVDKFTPGLKLYLWLGSYVVAPAALNWFYWRYQHSGATWQVVGRPVRPGVRRLALALAIVMMITALALYLRPDLLTAVAPWPMSPLIVRAFASIWGAFAVGPFWFAREQDWDRLYPVADMLMLMSGLWLAAIVLLQPDPQSLSPGIWLIRAGLAAIAIAGLGLRWLQRRPAQDRSSLAVS